MVINGDVSEKIALLVSGIQNGNERAFDELYRLTKERAYFVAIQFIKNEDDVQDILQESYIKALSKIKELDKPESFQSWLNQIVANKCKDFLKKKKPMLFEAEENEVYEILPDEDLNFRPEDSLDQSELQRTVMEILDELNEEKRACVLMMYFEELSVSEIAETLEIPEGTVKTRLFSARKDLKEKFSKRGITSAYSVAPIGVVLWAMRKTSATAGATFAASSGSATVLAGITASGVLATAGATAATATGGGIAAKIAALTVAQKVIAGASIAAVVAGSTAGVVTVVKNENKKDYADTTVYTEEHTTSPYVGTTIAIQAADGTVEFTLTDASATNGETAATVSSDRQTSETQISTAASTKPVSTTKSASTTRTTTAKQTTTKPTATKPTTTKLTTTKPTTAKPTTTKPTTAKPTSTKASTTKPTTTKSPTTNGSATIEIKVIDLDGKEIDKLTYTVDAGTEMTNSYLWNLVESKGYSISGVFGSAKGNAAQAGKTYTFEAEI